MLETPKINRIRIITLFAIIIAKRCDCVYNNSKSNLYFDYSILPLRGDDTDDNDKDDKQQVMMMTNAADVGENTEIGTIISVKTRKFAPYYFNKSIRTLGPDEIPARRTDVVLQLQEQRAREGAKAFHPGDINYELPGEVWPAVTFRVPQAYIMFTLTPAQSLPMRSFRDHFESIRPRYTANLDFLRKTADAGLDVYTLSKITWKHNFHLTTQPTNSVYKTASRTTTSNLSAPTNTVLSKLTDTKLHTNQITIKRPNVHEADYYIDDEYEEDVKRYYEHYDELRRGNAMLAVPRVITGKGLRTDSAVTVSTTHSTRKTTRTYPQPNWICYECGRNETTFGSPFCHNVFEMKYHKLNGRKNSLRYRCNGNSSVAYQCFKRFVDVGDYNERGCRNWPPRRSGTTYASKRLRAVEMLLKDKAEGCVFTPHAFLLAYSRTVQLYVRFHACVCKGYLCNGCKGKTECCDIRLTLGVVVIASVVRFFY